MRYRDLTGESPPGPLDAELYGSLGPEAKSAALTLLFSRASLPAPELCGLGADQAAARVAGLVADGRQAALAALWQVRRAGMAVLMRERRYDVYMLPDESRAMLWRIGARELRTRKPPVTFVVESTFSKERFDEAGVEAASALLYDLAALIAFVRADEASLSPAGVLQRRAQQRLGEYLSVKESLPPEAGPATAYPPRMGFVIDLARRAGLVQTGPSGADVLQEGPLSSAWLEAPPGRRLARILAAWASQLAGTEVDGLLVMDAARWMETAGGGVWVKGFAEAISLFEDEPYPAYRLVALIRTLQRLSWMGAVFMWKVRWSEPPPPSDHSGSVSVKPAPSQRRGLPPLADVAFALTGIGEILWEGLSNPAALSLAARLDSEDADEPAAEAVNGMTNGRAAIPGLQRSPGAQADAPGADGGNHRTGADGAFADRVGLDERLNAKLPPDEPDAIIQPNFEVLAPRQMIPSRLSRLIELSTVTRADRMVQMKLEVERAAACVRSGRWTPAEVLDLLSQASRHGVPQNVLFTLAEALKPLGRVQLVDGILVRADEPAVAAAIVEACKRSAIPLERITAEVSWIERRHLPALVRAAEASGYPVRPWVRGPRVPYPVERSGDILNELEQAARSAARAVGRLVERRPPPSLARGRRDLSYVAPVGEADLVPGRSVRVRPKAPSVREAPDLPMSDSRGGSVGVPTR